MTLFASIAFVAFIASVEVIDSDFLRIPPKLCLTLPREKNAMEVESMMTKRVIWDSSFMLVIFQVATDYCVISSTHVYCIRCSPVYYDSRISSNRNI